MKKIGWAIAAVVVIAASACIIPVYMDEGNRWSATAAAFRQTVPFEDGGVLRVDNVYGNIIIRGWERNEIEITAEETWNESAGVEAESLQGSEVVPQIDVTTKDNVVTIAARPRDDEFAELRMVHLLIQVPHHIILQSVVGRKGRIALSDIYGESRLRLEEGDIRVENYSGALDAELGKGEIQTELIDLRNEDTVRLVLNEGPITVRLEPEFNGRLEADAPEGLIGCDFKVDPPAKQSTVSGKIGTGEGALVIISARAGDISVRKSE